MSREARHSSASTNHYSPPDIIEAARRVMGGIDLDPATNKVANRVVKAKRIFTPADRRGEPVYLWAPGAEEAEVVEPREGMWAES